ncbi:hypothetical protein WT56_00305 [Burkholderia pseudomultivorans]|uniref:Uncharacterized protein n=2 Tax=Burkholderia pseudomultivorans TaxID=1207504 RepID=A0A132EE07_9BURK|nr:hypothetical protein [Burkholderia cepacia]AOI82544.1 hypothetical protein WI67_08885 [Burkholderia cepacia]KWF26602.1 hypothetical protein WT56_00305 [Burkholderia pseudomultivorans]
MKLRLLMQLLMIAHRLGVKRGRGDTREYSVGSVLCEAPHFLEAQDLGVLLLAVTDKESVIE